MLREWEESCKANCWHKCVAEIQSRKLDGLRSGGSLASK